MEAFTFVGLYVQVWLLGLSRGPGLASGPTSTCLWSQQVAEEWRQLSVVRKPLTCSYSLSEELFA